MPLVEVTGVPVIVNIWQCQFDGMKDVLCRVLAKELGLSAHVYIMMLDAQNLLQGTRFPIMSRAS